MAGLVLLGVQWLRVARAGDELDRKGLALASLVVLVPLAVMLSRAPAPRKVERFGGVTEFVIPTDASVPQGLRRVIVEGCVAMFRELGRLDAGAKGTPLQQRGGGATGPCSGRP